MAKPEPVRLPASLTAPITPAPYDVLPPICRTCNNTRQVTDPFNSSIKQPCPSC